MLKDVPRNDFGVTGMFSCLSSCLSNEGEDISPVILRGLWKELFMFTFSSEHGGGAHDWTLFPDFGTACEICSSLGRSYKYHKDLEWEQAWSLIKEAMDQKRPVMTTWEPPEIHSPWFALVVGYDEPGKKVYLHSYKGSFYEYSLDDFRDKWSKGRSEQPWLYGSILVVGKTEEKVDLKQTILRSFEGAVETMNKQDVSFPAIKGKFRDGTFVCGFRAYEELIDYLAKERDYSKLDTDSLKVIGSWGGCHEAGCEDRKRHEIADHLMYVASEFEPDQRRHIERAAQLYRGVECLYDNLLMIHPATTPWSRQGYSHLPSLTSEDPTRKAAAMRDFGRDMAEAAKIVRKIRDKEKEAITELEKVLH